MAEGKTSLDEKCRVLIWNARVNMPMDQGKRRNDNTCHPWWHMWPRLIDGIYNRGFPGLIPSKSTLEL